MAKRPAAWLSRGHAGGRHGHRLALIGVDGTALLLYLGAGMDDDGEGMLVAALATLVFGLGLMYAAYRKYRHGEHYEFTAIRAARAAAA
jgi:hypothetical protein